MCDLASPVFADIEPVTVILNFETPLRPAGFWRRWFNSFYTGEDAGYRE